MRETAHPLPHHPARPVVLHVIEISQLGALLPSPPVHWPTLLVGPSLSVLPHQARELLTGLAGGGEAEGGTALGNVLALDSEAEVSGPLTAGQVQVLPVLTCLLSTVLGSLVTDGAQVSV